jgi:HK97 gp10 family phage protein
MKAFIDITGIEEYMDKLVQAEKDLDAAAEKGLSAAGKVLFQAIYSRVPFDSGDPSNEHLRNHITLNGPFRDGDDHYLYVEVDKNDADARRYGMANEYGSSKMAAQSYIRAGKLSAKYRARQAMIAELKKVLNFE